MKYDIYFLPEVLADLNALKANVRAKVKDTLKEQLSFEPTKTSKSRIKRLKGLSKPQYRLRVDDIRVYYDVKADPAEVEILAVIPKDESEEWLAKSGVKGDGSSAHGSQG